MVVEPDVAGGSMVLVMLKDERVVCCATCVVSSVPNGEATDETIICGVVTAFVDPVSVVSVDATVVASVIAIDVVSVLKSVVIVPVLVGESVAICVAFVVIAVVDVSVKEAGAVFEPVEVGPG